MKKITLLTILLFTSQIMMSQIVIDNLPDTIIHLLEKEVIVESYCMITIEKEILTIQIAPLDRTNSKDVYLYENSNRIIKLSNKKVIKVISVEDFFLVKDKIDKMKSTASNNTGNNENYFLYKFYTSGRFIGKYGYQ